MAKEPFWKVDWNKLNVLVPENEQDEYVAKLDAGIENEEDNFYIGLGDESAILGTQIMNLFPDGAKWEKKREWYKSDKTRFSDYIITDLPAYEDKYLSCAQLALALIVYYAGKEGLPLILYNNSGTSFDISSSEFISLNDYWQKVAWKILAKDLVKNTFEIPRKETTPGDMVLMHIYKHDYKDVNNDHCVVYYNFNAKNTTKNIIFYGNMNGQSIGQVNRSPYAGWWLPYASYNDGNKEKIVMYTSGDNYSRWNMLNDANLETDPVKTEDVTTPADTLGE